MRGIPSSKVAYEDVIPISLLKQGGNDVAALISDICARSFAEGTYPAGLKKAIITPVPKKSDGDMDDITNYRPISNLKVVGKIIEIVAATRLKKHIENLSFLHSNQSAYRSHHSTESATLTVCSDWRNALDSGKCVCVASLDVSAAFDTVNHAILQNRLLEAGVLGKAHKWFQSYLSGRSWVVKHKDSFSEVCNVNSGVPQGSVLGPLLFNAYMASLAHLLDKIKMTHSDFNFHIYADDVLLYYACSPEDIKCASNHLGQIIIAVNEWMQKNSLQLNVLKTDLLIINSSRRKLTICGEPNSISVSMDNKRLDFRTSGTLLWLGVLFDVHLTMADHIQKISTTCFGILRMIKRIRGTLDLHSTRLLCNSMVISRIDYCNALFNNTDKLNIKKLQRVMNLAARLIKRAPRRDHVTPLLKELGWFPVEIRIIRKIAILVFKVIKLNQPAYLHERLTVYKPRRDLRSSLSSSTQLVLGSAKGTYGKGAWTVCAPKLWNELPKEVTSCETLSLFLQRLDKHLNHNIMSA
jgi:hypothetical protein